MTGGGNSAFPSIAFSLRDADRAGGWADHVRGVTWALRDAGHGIRGYEASITSRLQAGAGLGSSAALEVALLRALREEFVPTWELEPLYLRKADAEINFETFVRER